MGRNRNGPTWYAVRVGRKSGVYSSWPECQAQVNGYSGAVFKSFGSEADAWNFVGSNGAPLRPCLKRAHPDEPGSFAPSFALNYGNKRLHTNLDSSAEAFQGFPTYGVNSESPSRDTAYVGTFTHYRTQDSGSNRSFAASPAPRQATASYDAQKTGWVYFDGGSRGNGLRGNLGVAGCGAAVHIPYDSTTSMPACNDSAYLGVRTNNEAEYEGLILGLLLALEEGCTHVHIKGDSKLVINQVNGTWRVLNPRLAQLCNTAQSLLGRFQHWDASHVYRESNSLADALANSAMDGCNPGRGIPSCRAAQW